MKKLLTILLLVFVGQLSLAGLLWYRVHQRQHFETGVLLAGLSEAQSSRIVIADSEQQLTLLKKDGHWILPDKFGVQADELAVSNLFAEALSWELSWPAGRTMLAAKSFLVHPEAFERRLEFSSDAGAQIIYLGATPSQGKIYGRREGTDETHVLRASVTQYPVSAQHWMDKTLTRIAPDQVAGINLEALTLVSQDSVLTLADIKMEEVLKRVELDAFVGKLLELKYSDILGVEVADKEAKPVYSYSVELKSGEKVLYNFFSTKDETYFILKSSQSPYYFKIEGGVLKEIRETKRSDFIELEVAEET